IFTRASLQRFFPLLDGLTKIIFLLHPRFEVVRTYHVWVDKDFSSSQIKKVLKEGVEVEGKNI
ncbi:MAG: hypothetical protein LM579_02265, partial [Thermodesulfobacterium sp.]|nr:hypothetical protein [Thermodesulfobacterium sp.]